MGLFQKAKRFLSSGPSISDKAEIWAFDVHADKKPIDEYDLIVMFSDDEALPIFLHVEEEMFIPEGTLAYQSTDSDWGMEVNDDAIVRVIPCKLIPPTKTDEIDREQPDVIEVPEKLTGGNIPASREKEDDLSDLKLRELM